MTSTSKAMLEVLDDLKGRGRRVAGWLPDVTVARDGILAIALSGGSAPRRHIRGRRHIAVAGGRYRYIAARDA